MTRLTPALLALLGCQNDQRIGKVGYDHVAVVAGDFDEFEAVLGRNGMTYTAYEGFISQPTYDPELRTSDFDKSSESLFRDLTDEGVSMLMNYDAVFLNSGSRGFGHTVYNGVHADDDLVTDANVRDHVEAYVQDGRQLVVSDWGYDLIEAVWPDAISFLWEDEGLDNAQRGKSGDLRATVTDSALARALGTDEVLLSYDFSHWAVIESVSSDVTVYMRGDVRATPDDAELGDVKLVDVPLLVGVPVNGGELIFSTFHWRSQHDSVGNALLETLVGRLKTEPQEAQVNE